MEWKKLDKGEYVATNRDRVFVLSKGSRGCQGQGTAYYLKTKLISETKFEQIKDVVTRSDNHGLAVNQEVKKQLEIFKTTIFEEFRDMHAVFSVAEKYAEAMYGGM